MLNGYIELGQYSQYSGQRLQTIDVIHAQNIFALVNI